MFEEIPRRTRGSLSPGNIGSLSNLASLGNFGNLGNFATRRVVLGPFAIGGGIALATLGGSVAVAATVITASTLGIVDGHPNHPHQRAAALLATASSSSAHPTVPGTSVGSSTARPSTPAGHAPTGARAHAPASPPMSHQRVPASAAPRSTPPPNSVLGVGASAPESSSSPAGNAVVFFDGYDPASGALLFRYADVAKGGGPRGSDAYSTEGGAKQYQAPLAAGASIVSGNTMCPPAGSRCTPSQLDSAAVNGMYAEVGIGPAGRLESVIERDNTPDNAAGANSPSAPSSGGTAGGASAATSSGTSGGSKSAGTPTS